MADWDLDKESEGIIFQKAQCKDKKTPTLVPKNKTRTTPLELYPYNFC